MLIMVIIAYSNCAYFMSYLSVVNNCVVNYNYYLLTIMLSLSQNSWQVCDMIYLFKFSLHNLTAVCVEYHYHYNIIHFLCFSICATFCSVFYASPKLFFMTPYIWNHIGDQPQDFNQVKLHYSSISWTTVWVDPLMKVQMIMCSLTYST